MDGFVLVSSFCSHSLPSLFPPTCHKLFASFTPVLEMCTITVQLLAQPPEGSPAVFPEQTLLVKTCTTG